MAVKVTETFLRCLLELVILKSSCALSALLWADEVLCLVFYK